MRTDFPPCRTAVWLAALGTLSVLLVQVSSAQAPATRAPALNLPEGDAKRGAEIYLKDGCWQCHGYTGATGTAAPLVLMGLSADRFVSYIRNPRTRAMPLYSAKVIPDAAAADLYAYIKTFKKPPEVKDLPLLQQIINEK